MKHILNHYYKIFFTNFSRVQRRENGLINSGDASWVGFELNLQEQIEFSWREEWSQNARETECLANTFVGDMVHLNW